MALFLEILITSIALGLAGWLLRKMLGPRAPAEPADDPFALVGAPLKRGPKGRAGAVALDEPEDDRPGDSIPPRSL